MRYTTKTVCKESKDKKIGKHVTCSADRERFYIHTQNNRNKENKVHATEDKGLKRIHELVDTNITYSILKLIIFCKLKSPSSFVTFISYISVNAASVLMSVWSEFKVICFSHSSPEDFGIYRINV